MAAALTNATAIGAGAIFGQSNALVLGNGADIGTSMLRANLTSPDRSTLPA